MIEGTNVRHIKKLPEPVDVVTIDASFISQKILLPVVRTWFPSIGGNQMVDNHVAGNKVVLIKPQFKAG